VKMQDFIFEIAKTADYWGEITVLWGSFFGYLTVK